METTKDSKSEEQSTDAIFWCARPVPVKLSLLLLSLAVFFLALCVVVFADGPRQQLDYCDPESELAVALQLSREQCERIREIGNRLSGDSASLRGNIVEKRLQLKGLYQDGRADPYTINKAERELKTLEWELSRRMRQAESDQRRLLSPEQINKLKEVNDGYSRRGYGRRGYWKAIQR
jgi:Spy/CpxP family protein refolding chaperone